MIRIVFSALIATAAGLVAATYTHFAKKSKKRQASTTTNYRDSELAQFIVVFIIVFLFFAVDSWRRL